MEISNKTEKAKYYGKDLEAMNFAVNYHSWIYDELKPFIGKRLIEVGAGNGSFSEILLQSNPEQLVAIEPSENIFPELAKRFAKNKIVELINGPFKNNSFRKSENFDSVLFINVLEHIKNDFSALETAFKVLKDDGTLLIFVPAFNFLYSNFDKRVGHYRRYRKEPLEEKVKKAGFKVVQSKYFDSLGIVPWFFAFVMLKQEPSCSNVALYDNLVVPFLRKVEKKFTPPFGKNLLLIAKK